MATTDLSCIYFIATEQLIVRSSEQELFSARAYSGGARTTEGNPLQVHFSRRADNFAEFLGELDVLGRTA